MSICVFRSLIRFGDVQMRLVNQMGVVLLLTIHGLAIGPATGGEPGGATGPPPRQPILDYQGEVIGVDGRSITIRGFGAQVSNSADGWCNATGSEGTSMGPKMTVCFPDREIPCSRLTYTREKLTMVSPEGVVTTLKRADQTPRKFEVDAVLAAGKFHPDLLPGQAYRLADVKVGDEVFIQLCRERDDGLCYSISIRRRPGGLVPPSPGALPGIAVQFHEIMNAHQDFEEHGTPIPEKFLPPKFPMEPSDPPPIPPAKP